MSTLVLNAGSSSIKFALFQSQDIEQPYLSGQIEGIGHNASLIINGQQALPISCSDHKHAIQILLETLKTKISSPISALGHRVVHGGEEWSKPLLLNPKNLNRLNALIPLAPLHMPHHINAIQACFHSMPGVPQVACFDTAFHQSQPPEITTPPLPQEWQHLKRYGFHGLSYQHIVRHLPSLHNDKLPQKILAAHLGNGASLCAIINGKSFATTMGFSTLDGLIMGSRSGAIDPGVLLHLLRVEHISPETLHHKLYHQSGLLGLSHGLSSDVRTLSESKNPHAKFALNKLVSSLTQHAGGLIALMGGIDAFVFTGGIGENARHIRQQLIENLNFLGLNLNNTQNQKSKEGLISNPEDTIPIFIVNANEEAVIASLALECISSHQKSS